MFSKRLPLALLLVIILTTFLSPVLAEETPPQKSYRRSEIADARFGSGDKEVLLKKAYGFAEFANKTIKGQEVAAAVIQERLIQYLENFGTRTKEPIALNLIGLPGIGKSDLLKMLRRLELPTLYFDAQKYDKPDASLSDDIATGLSDYLPEKKPVIVVVEEVDKVPEITENGRELPFNSAVTGTLNQILSDGIITQRYGKPLDVSNVLVLTTMNFSPKEIQSFTKEVLSESKSFYDLTLDDFEKFDVWLKKAESARYKILSKLFRSNTVSRYAPNTIIMQPLLKEAYKEIVNLVVEATVKRNTEGANAVKRIGVEVDESFKEFLAKETVYAPSGARETVFRSDALTEQLITFGVKSSDPNDKSIDRPRNIKIAFDAAKDEAILIITPRVIKGGTYEDKESYTFNVAFSRSARLFIAPAELAVEKPTYNKSKAQEPKMTQEMIRNARFPKRVELTDGLEEAINNKLVGQEELVRLIKEDMDRYLAKEGPSKKEPSYRILAGFPGIGKSEIARTVAKHLGLKVIKINMQQFSSDDASTVANFFDTFAKLFQENQNEIKEGRFILLLEELDKIFEIDPDGKLKNRPVMGVIKDLLNDGVATTVTKGSYRDELKTIDIRSAHAFVTMNFAIDRFGFVADPRLTTIEDIVNVNKKLKKTQMEVKSLLGKMFLPDTISRLMARFTLVDPPDRKDYAQIIKRQMADTVQNRVSDSKNNNITQIEVETTARYNEYLFLETIIPSEGVRNTVVGVNAITGSNLEDAINAIPRSSKYARKPIVITLDHMPGRKKFVAKVRLRGEDKKMAQAIFEKPTVLAFPPLNINGRLSEGRMHVSAHEFGHAFMMARLGLRFEFVVVAPPSSDMGGYVKFKDGQRQSALDMMGVVYATLASRAFERMFLTGNAKDPNSVMGISSGASMDIKQATYNLYNMIYELGFDPNGGTIDRNFALPGFKYANYDSLPSTLAEKLGLILRDIENQIVDDMLETETQDWYVKRIVELAQAGSMNEETFYKLIGYKHPKIEKGHVGESFKSFRELFGKYIHSAPASLTATRKQKRGKEQLTVDENIEKYLKEFSNIVKKHLHPDKIKDCDAALTK